MLLMTSHAQTTEAARSTTRAATFPDAAGDPKKVEEFLDHFFTVKMQEFHCPGAVVAVVKDGKILLAKGYGHADVSRQIPADPEKTRFYIASVSKLFTATAVMQHYDRGALRLDADVNAYLKHTQLDNNYPQPVTPFNLLTHTAGLEDLSFLMGGTPHRVFPPGAVISYSNYGFELAGQMVADIAGTPFADYVERNIFQPLEMTHSSFVPPPDSVSDVALGYIFEGGKVQPFGRPMSGVSPAGSAISTATDMARFMIAQVHGGGYGEVHILSETAARLMHQRQISNHAKLPGMVSLLNLGFVVGATVTFAVVGPYGLGNGVPTPIKWLLVLPLVTAPLSPVLLVLDVMAWKRAWWTLAARLMHSVYTIAALAFIAYLNYWNLLGFHY